MPHAECARLKSFVEGGQIMQDIWLYCSSLWDRGDRNVMGGVTDLSRVTAWGDRFVTPQTARLYGEKVLFWGVLEGQILHTICS